jgi:hypothetical protein
MKKIFASLALFSTLCVPVIAQPIDDTASSAAENPAEIRAEVQENVAVMPTGIPGDTNLTVAATAASPLPLSMTDDQLEKIAKLKADFSDTSAGTIAQIHKYNRQLRDLLIKEQPDKAQALDLQAKINGLKNDMANAQLNMRLEAISLLSPDQKQQLRHASLQRQVFGRIKAHKMHHFDKRKAPAQPVAPPA